MLIKDAESLNYALNDAQIEPMLPRGYMGLSNIGEKCYRKLQFDHYWAYKIRRNKRMDRLLRTGHLLEPMVIAEIVSLGFEIVECGVKIVGAAGHWQGHEDVILFDGEKRLLAEIKTHKNSEFAKLKKKGFVESHPKHHQQMNAYMGYKKLMHGIYIAINKDTSEMYVEYLEFDQGLFEEIKIKQYDIIAVDYLHKRIGNNSPAWFECKLCDACDVCFGKVPVEKNYRTDARTDVNDDGIWSIEGMTIPLLVQSDEPKNFTYNPIFDSI